MPILKIIFVFCVACFVSSSLLAQQPVPPPPKPADDSPSLEATMKFIQDKLNAIGPLRYSVGRRAIDADRDSVFDETDEVTSVVADPQRCTISYRLQESAKPVGEQSSRDFNAGHGSGPGPSEARTRLIGYPQPQRSYQVPGRPQESARSRNNTFVVDLKEVQKITVRSVEQDLNEASGGRISWTIQPAIFEVVAQTHLAGYRRQLSMAPGPPAPSERRQQSQDDFFAAFFGPQAPNNGNGAILGAFVGGNQPQSVPTTPRPQGTLSGPLPRENGVFSVDDEELAKRLARALLHAVELCTPDKKAEPF